MEMDCDMIELYKNKIEYIRTEAENLLFENPSWEICKRSNDIIVSRVSSPHSKLHAIKTETTISLEMNELSRRVHPCGPYRTKWDTTLERVEIVHKLNYNDLILRHVTKPQLMGLISCRDSVDLYSFSQTDECRSVVAGSIETNLCLPDPAHIRSWSFPAALYLYRTVDKDCTRVVSLFNADMHLHLVPTSIAESFVPRCGIMLMEQMKKCPNLKEEQYDTLPGWP